MALMSLKNLTIGVWDDGLTVKIDKINNKLIGYVGMIFDKSYVHKNKRDCILQSVEYFEDNHSNKSFFQMAKNDKIDIYYSPMKNKFSSIPEYLANTKIVSTTPFQLGQFLIKPTKFQQTDLSSFLFNNINLLLTILIGYLLIVLSFFIFIKLIDRRIKIKFYDSLSLDYRLYSLSFKFELLKLFFNLFLFINLILLTNNIKTDKVIVKTDEFLNTDEKLLKSSKRFVFNEFNEDKYRLSAKTNLIYKLYQKKVNLEQNYLKITTKYTLFQQRSLIEKLSSFFMVDDKFTSLYCFIFLSSYSNNDEFLYLDNRNYFEISSLFYFRKSLNKETKNMIHWSTNQYFENGIYLESESNLLNQIYKLITNNGISIILNVNDYIDQQSLISDLEITNFQNIFRFFSFILFLIYLIFIINLKIRLTHLII